MQTYFAPAERARDEDFRADVDYVTSDPVIESLMNVMSGFLAILNEQRQILALNGALLDMLGVKDPGTVLGLRPGEAAGCVHAHENMPGGCGTARHCETCGAAIAMVSALKSDEPHTRTCSMAVEKNGQTSDLFLMVRALPMTAQGHRYILLFLQDITSQQKLASLTQVFFHDINNISTALLTAAQLLKEAGSNPDQNLVLMVNDLSQRLVNEIALQKCLTLSGMDRLPMHKQMVSPADILNSIQLTFSRHPARAGREIVLPQTVPETKFQTDMHLLLRVLDNMIINALEATPAGGRIKLKVETTGVGMCFSVWNAQAIPPELALRIFQRNISTKADIGRGLGTYSMKLFGEQFLGGKVSFTSSEADGTEFSICLPKSLSSHRADEAEAV